MKYLVQGGKEYVRDIASSSPIMIADKRFAKIFDNLADAQSAASIVTRCGLKSEIEIYIRKVNIAGAEINSRRDNR